jgi:hypothetical protein
VTTVADRTSQKCAQLQHNICVDSIHTCNKKVYLHLQKFELRFAIQTDQHQTVTHTCRYISGVLANPSSGNLPLPATAAQAQPKSPAGAAPPHAHSLAPAPLTRRSVSAALSETHKHIPAAPLTCRSVSAALSETHKHIPAAPLICRSVSAALSETHKHIPEAPLTCRSQQLLARPINTFVQHPTLSSCSCCKNTSFHPSAVKNASVISKFQEHTVFSCGGAGNVPRNICRKTSGEDNIRKTKQQMEH